jgi:hypothetical protein
MVAPTSRSVNSFKDILVILAVYRHSYWIPESNSTLCPGVSAQKVIEYKSCAIIGQFNAEN